MATTRLMPLHIGKGRTVGTAIADIIDYVANPEKTDYGNLITSWQCDSRVADAQFVYNKQQYIRQTGKIQGKDNVIAYHLRQSFRPGEITAEEANRLGCELARRFTKENHAYIVCTHIDKAHIHNHIIWNSTSLDATRKFRNFWGSTKAIRRLNDTICIQNGYSIVENPQPKGLSYDKWLADKKKPSHRERICFAIDAALAKNPVSFNALLEILQQEGYELKQGKVPSLRGPEQRNYIRMDTLGENYTPEVLGAVIKGQRIHAPKIRNNQQRNTDKRNIQLIIDYQTAVNSKKGPAYENWAKRFNMKQASQALLYLQEHNLTQYSDLEKQAAILSSELSKARKQNKEMEDKLQKNAVTQKHIQNYKETREIYVAYRKAGYSKKFLSEHESDIIRHQAAKRYFDELGVEKLPTAKQLKAEYKKTLTQKQAAFAQYKKVKKQQEEFLTVKANIDILLKDSPKHSQLVTVER